jgi:hypothetical protein
MMRSQQSCILPAYLHEGRNGCDKVAPACNGKPSSYELMQAENAKEASLRTLMIAGLGGDGAAYRALLSELSGHLRAYYRGRLVRAGRGMEETEDLVQEALIAVHARRHTYDPRPGGENHIFNGSSICRLGDPCRS